MYEFTTLIWIVEYCTMWQEKYSSSLFTLQAGIRHNIMPEKQIVITEATDKWSEAYCLPWMHVGLEMLYEINSAIDL